MHISLHKKNIQTGKILSIRSKTVKVYVSKTLNYVIHINGFCLNQIDICFIHDFVNLDIK